MKTTEIVSNLLKFSDEHEWTSQEGFIRCLECGGNPAIGHKENCLYIVTKEAAREYLKLMNPVAANASCWADSSKKKGL